MSRVRGPWRRWVRGGADGADDGVSTGAGVVTISISSSVESSSIGSSSLGSSSVGSSLTSSSSSGSSLPVGAAGVGRVAAWGPAVGAGKGSSSSDRDPPGETVGVPGMAVYNSSSESVSDR